MTDSSSLDDETGKDLVPAAPLAAPDPNPQHPNPPLDAHGFNLADFRWVPVLRKPRADGWTPQRQVTFIVALADTGVVRLAAEEAGMTVSSCYKLRRSPGAESFAAAWTAALHHSIQRIEDVAFERAIEGVEEPVFNRDGQRVGARRRYNDRLVMFMLRAHRPDTYRHAHKDVRQDDEPCRRRRSRSRKRCAGSSRSRRPSPTC